MPVAPGEGATLHHGTSDSTASMVAASRSCCSCRDASRHQVACFPRIVGLYVDPCLTRV